MHNEPFLSTPSARRATRGTCAGWLTLPDFYPRPPRGGRPLDSWHYGDNYKISIHALREEGDEITGNGQDGALISIHALREEGDTGGMPRPRAVKVFLSTPSARRATLTSAITAGSTRFLSTPSARRATPAGRTQPQADGNFYPRPPRGGRLSSAALMPP